MSEVARLLKEIEIAYQAARNGFDGLASGVSRHDFINKKMEHIEEQRKALALHVGLEQAMELIVEILATV